MTELTSYATYNPCPRCDRPIADTAYICDNCAQRLADRLRSAADNWDAVRAAVGFDIRVESIPSSWLSQRPKVGTVGPTCAGMRCDHESCEAVWKSRSRNRAAVGRAAREDRGPVDWSRSEKAWIIENTATAWATFVADRRGNRPVPSRRSRPVAAPTPRVRVVRCEFSDLPIETCGCGREHAA